MSKWPEKGLELPAFVFKGCFGCTPARSYGEFNSKKTFFGVIDMRFSKKTVSKQFVHVILGIGNDYV